MHSFKFLLTGAFGCLLIFACKAADPGADDRSVLPLSAVQWEQLNPARGDQSPRAATLWGERTGPGPAGFLLRPVDGFRSPPHIHNVAYRGVVIRGLIHNDTPVAEDLWMSSGAFWTQPAGGVHITAAQGSDALAYIEVEDQFGVLPAEQAFNSGEQARNIVAAKIVWSDRAGVAGVQSAELWGDPREKQASGSLLRLPARFKGTLRGALRGVLIQGTAQFGSDAALTSGSLIRARGAADHSLACVGDGVCLLYVRAEGAFNLSRAAGE